MAATTTPKPGAGTRVRGAQGEQLAAAYLREHGYTIVELNWHCKGGEIDIVARHGETLVFVEVRLRRRIDDALSSLAGRKAERMAAAAQQYLSAHALEDALWQVDAIAVAVSRGETTIEHVEHVLAW